MIMTVVLIVKILLPAAVIAIGWRMLRKKVSRGSMAAMAVMVAAFAAAANVVAGLLPPLKDVIVLTALGERHADAFNDEVCLSGYTVDGKEYSAGEDLQIQDGKWFWAGEKYLWRNETDPRQPEGTTRSISIKVPVGIERALLFDASVWDGKVEITSGGKSWVVDTYSPDLKTLAEPITSSSTSSVLKNEARSLVLYFLSFSAAVSLMVIIVRRAAGKTEAVKRRRESMAQHAVYFCIALVAFALMFHYSGKISFWGDELLQLKGVAYGLKTGLEQCLQMVDATPPLYTICAWAWYNIMPYGDSYLRLLSLLPAAISIYVAGLVGGRLRGKYCGVLMAVMTGLSTTFWTYALIFRAYSLMMMFMFLVLYFHIRRGQSNRGKRWHVLYSFALLGLVMSHYFGMVGFAIMLAADILLVCRKKSGWRSLLSYILPICAMAAWLGLVYAATLSQHSTAEIANWYGVPDVSYVLGLLRFLTGYFELPYWILLAGGAYALVCLLHKKLDDTLTNDFYMVLSLAALAGTILIMFIYGRFINRQSTMWIDRYFLFLFPFVSYLSAAFLTAFIETMKSLNCSYDIVGGTVCISLSALLFFNCITAQTSSVSPEPFRESADYIYSLASDIFYPTTAVVVTHGFIGDIYEDHYIERDGRRDALNCIAQYELTEVTLLSYDKIYLQYTHIGLMPWLQAALDANFTLTESRDDVNLRVYARNT